MDSSRPCQCQDERFKHFCLIVFSSHCILLIARTNTLLIRVIERLDLPKNLAKLSTQKVSKSEKE